MKDVSKVAGLIVTISFPFYRTGLSAIPMQSEIDLQEDKEIPTLIQGEGTILLVDDEELLRDVVLLELESLGYKILIAKDGKHAIEIYKVHQDDIDLVIMDMMMPKMNGTEAFKRIIEINHNAAVIIASGYTKDENIDELFKKGLKGFIQKPFSVEKLSVEISRCMPQK